MSKIHRLAVLICGDFRTWKNAAPYIFRFCDSFSGSVDYYFSTWSKTHEWPDDLNGSKYKTVTDQDVLGPFNKKNLIDFKILDLPKQHEKFFNTFYYQAYLAKVANTLKNRYEFKNNFLYDYVIETRPDMYLGKGVTNCLENIKQLGDFEYVNGVIFQIDSAYPQCSDVYYRASTFCNDVISNRFFRNGCNTIFFKDPSQLEMFVCADNHWLLLEYLYSRKLISLPQLPNELDRHIPIRSHYIDFDFDNFSDAEIQTLQKNWINNTRINSE